MQASLVGISWIPFVSDNTVYVPLSTVLLYNSNNSNNKFKVYYSNNHSWVSKTYLNFGGNKVT